MDPETLLEELLKEAGELQKKADNEEFIHPVDVFQLASGVLALHEWICKGGFLPTKWSAGRWVSYKTHRDQIHKLQAQIDDLIEKMNSR